MQLLSKSASSDGGIQLAQKHLYQTVDIGLDGLVSLNMFMSM